MWLRRECRFAPILSSHGAAHRGAGFAGGAPIGAASACRLDLPRLRFPSFDVLSFPARVTDRASAGVSPATWTAVLVDRIAARRGPDGFTGRKASARRIPVIHQALARGPPVPD
jgi:hypothetical protein